MSPLSRNWEPLKLDLDDDEVATGGELQVDLSDNDDDAYDSDTDSVVDFKTPMNRRARLDTLADVYACELDSNGDPKYEMISAFLGPLSTTKDSTTDGNGGEPQEADSDADDGDWDCSSYESLPAAGSIEEADLDDGWDGLSVRSGFESHPATDSTIYENEECRTNPKKTCRRD